MRHRPTDPLYLKAEEAEMKIPEPIMVPTMWQVAASRPKSLFRLTVEDISTNKPFSFEILSDSFVLPVNETPLISTSSSNLSSYKECAIVIIKGHSLLLIFKL